MKNQILKKLEEGKKCGYENEAIANELLNLYDSQKQKAGIEVTLIAWEQFKKANWYESESMDVEKMLIDKFKSIYKNYL